MEIVAPGTWALVTGASSGIGEAIARNLSARKVPVLLAARSAAKLESLAAELSAANGAAARAVPCDLSRPDGAGALFEATEGAGLPVSLLVNNAGFGLNGASADLPVERVLEMLQVNVTSLTALTQLFLAPMRARRGGGILNVASTAAFVANPFFNAYSATKAYVLSYSLGLRVEVEPDGIVVTCLCPGYTKTGFFDVAGMSSRSPLPVMEPDAVAEAGVAGLLRGAAFVVPNVLDRTWIASTRLAPRTVPPRLSARLFSRSRKDPGAGR